MRRIKILCRHQRSPYNYGVDFRQFFGIIFPVMTHKPIKTEFRWTGDGFGNSYSRIIKQIKRVGDIAIYERRVEKSNTLDGYEVVKIGRHNGYTLGGQYVAPAETYPGASQFGKQAWSCLTLDQAEQCFNLKLKEVEEMAAQDALRKASGIVIKKRGRPRKVVV